MTETWQEKLEDKPSLQKVVRLEKTFPCYNAVHEMGKKGKLLFNGDFGPT